MTIENTIKFRTIPEALRRKHILRRNGQPFDASWLEGAMGNFDGALVPVWVEYEALLELDGHAYNGFVRVYNDGAYSVHMEH